MSANPFQFSAKTRDGQTAYFNRLCEEHVVAGAGYEDEPVGFVLMGCVGGQPWPNDKGAVAMDLWTALGCYAYDCEPHRLDLMIKVK